MICPNCKIINLTDDGRCIICGPTLIPVKSRSSEEIHKILNAPTVQQVNDKPEPEEDCFHTCSNCGEVWSHNIAEKQCPAHVANGHAVRNLRCANCTERANAPSTIQQDVVEINRPSALAEFKAESLHTGQEISQLMTEHESFVVLNLVYDERGAKRLDRLERIDAHIINLKRMMESLRIKDSATRKVKAEMQIEELGKLSPEEREAYKAQAKKRASGAKPKAPKDAGEAPATYHKKEEKMAAKLLRDSRTGGAAAIPMVCSMFNISPERARELMEGKA